MSRINVIVRRNHTQVIEINKLEMTNNVSHDGDILDIYFNIVTLIAKK